MDKRLAEILKNCRENLGQVINDSPPSHAVGYRSATDKSYCMITRRNPNEFIGEKLSKSDFIHIKSKIEAIDGAPDIIQHMVLRGKDALLVYKALDYLFNNFEETKLSDEGQFPVFVIGISEP